MNKIKFISLTASLVLATTFTLSCDSKDPNSFKDSRDGKKYKTVTIGSQIWMAENLNYAAEGSVCYENNPDNCAKYGRLYDWATAMMLSSTCNSTDCSNLIQSKHQGICPSGWHLPSKDEYEELLYDNDGDYHAVGKKLKAKSGWNDNDGKPGDGTDDFGFSALPGGFGNSGGGSFGGVGNVGNWWGTNDISGTWASILEIRNPYGEASLSSGVKSNLLSVRCVWDKPAPVAADSGSGGKIMYVNDEKGLNMRSEPSTDGVKLGTLFYGTKVKVLEKSSTPVTIGGITDHWYKIDANSWVFGGYLSEKPPEGGTLTDSRDGKVYRKVKIGYQVWMAENLNYKVRGHSRCYDDKAENCEKYGRLYGLDPSVCPAGWRLPIDADWNALAEATGGEKAGKKLKSSRGWKGNGNGTDNYGFSALPGGYGSYDDRFGETGENGYWWSKSLAGISEDVSELIYWAMQFDGDYVVNRAEYGDGARSFSVRCVQESDDKRVKAALAANKKRAEQIAKNYADLVEEREKQDREDYENSLKEQGMN